MGEKNNNQVLGLSVRKVPAKREKKALIFFFGFIDKLLYKLGEMIDLRI